MFCLLPEIIFRVHVNRDDIRQAIIVEISNVIAHGIAGSMFETE